MAHVELTREVARRFNQLYPGKFFTSPEAAAWEMPAILDKARKLAGELPGLSGVRTACAFAPRCPQCMPACTAAAIPTFALPDGRQVRCLLYADG